VRAGSRPVARTIILVLSKNTFSTFENTKRFMYTEIMKTEAKAKVTMNCPDCDNRCASFGKHRNGLRRFRCGDCGKTYTEAHAKPSGEMTVPMGKAILALKMLLEGLASVQLSEPLISTAIQSYGSWYLLVRSASALWRSMFVMFRFRT
jgi:transposase-like protein